MDLFGLTKKLRFKASFIFIQRLGVRNLRNKNKGFTLIELLVVIAIIGLLASVVLLALNSARAKSRDAKRVADIRQIASAMELYFNDNSSYPTSSSNNAATANGVYQDANLKSLLVPKYIGALPQSPSPQDGSCSATVGLGGNEYYWQGGGGAGVQSNYTITFCLGGVTGGYGAGQHTLTSSGIQ